MRRVLVSTVLSAIVAAGSLGLNAPTSAASISGIQTVIVVMMENTNWATVKGSPGKAPYIDKTLLPNFASADNYRTGLHPSLPNYIALEAGDPMGMTDSSFLPADHPVDTTDHLTTYLDNAGISWKYYGEDLPGDGTTCNLTDFSTSYSEDHNPFAYFSDVQTRTDYCIAHERPYSELATDLAAGTAPRYAFVVPNDYNQGGKTAPGSTCRLCQADTWLSHEIPMMQASSAYTNGGAILLLWDECAPNSTTTSGLVVISSLAKKGYHDPTAYSHASTLRSLQEIFDVTPLLRSAATSNDLSNLFTVPLTPPVTPVASFTATPTSGSAPLGVAFKDTSTGPPTSWAWDFGDGTTSTSQSPNHTYADAGSYTVSLTATNGVGSNTATTTDLVVVSPGTGSAGTITFHDATAGSAVASSLSLPVPAGAVLGDVVVASLSVRGAPTITPPVGWTLVRQDVSSTTLRLATFTHTVGPGDPATTTWKFSSSHAAAGILSAYGGVQSAVPVDVSGGMANAASTNVTAPSLTTAAADELLVGVFADKSDSTFTPPAGMTERAEVFTPSTTYKTAIGLDDQPWPSKGATGTRTAISSVSSASIGQLLALLPAPN